MGHINCMHCACMPIRQHSYLGTLAKLRKTIITFILSVCQFTGPHEITRFFVDGFSSNFIFEDLSKTCGENFKYRLKSDMNNKCFINRPMYIYDNITLNSS
jgi:hypothetical protein